MQYAFLGALIFVVPSSTLDVGRPAEEYQVLVKEWGKAYRNYRNTFAAAKTDEERKKILPSFPRPMFQGRFMELARKYPKDPAAIDSLVWVLKNPWSGPRAEKNYARDGKGDGTNLARGGKGDGTKGTEKGTERI